MLIIFTPIAFIEQQKNNNKDLLLNNETFDKFKLMDNNNHQLTNLIFETNEHNSVEIKNCWEEGDLASQKRYCSSKEKLFNSMNR